TNSVTPTASGAPVVTGSVQYLDVGLTLEVQPTIYLDSDVAIKLSLEVSSILKQVATASGTIAYEIGTRNANTLLRLKDGETQILAGLIQESDTRTANTIPGLGDIPILSRLFGTHHTDHEKDEIVLSITPRIIRPRLHADDARRDRQHDLVLLVVGDMRAEEAREDRDVAETRDGVGGTRVGLLDEPREDLRLPVLEAQHRVGVARANLVGDGSRV